MHVDILDTFDEERRRELITGLRELRKFEGNEAISEGLNCAYLDE